MLLTPSGFSYTRVLLTIFIFFPVENSESYRLKNLKIILGSTNNIVLLK